MDAYSHRVRVYSEDMIRMPRKLALFLEKEEYIIPNFRHTTSTPTGGNIVYDLAKGVDVEELFMVMDEWYCERSINVEDKLYALD